MYTRASLLVRLFTLIFSALNRWLTLQIGENHALLSSVEEGGPVEPLYSKALLNLHIVILDLLCARFVINPPSTL